MHLCILIVFRFDAVSQQDPAGAGGNNSGGHNDSLRSDNEKSFNILIEEGNNNSMLKNFDGPLDNNEMCTDVDDDDPEEDPEKLAELEQRQEDLIEEFLELAFNKKQEHTEEVKADCKKNNVEKEETKKLVAEAQKKMD